MGHCLSRGHHSPNGVGSGESNYTECLSFSVNKDGLAKAVAEQYRQLRSSHVLDLTHNMTQRIIHAGSELKVGTFFSGSEVRLCYDSSLDVLFLAYICFGSPLGTNVLVLLWTRDAAMTP